MKVCSTCDEEKEESAFEKTRASTRRDCKACRKIYHRLHKRKTYAADPEKALRISRESRERCRDRRLADNKTPEFRAQANLRARKRRRDIQVKLAHNLRVRLRCAVGRGTKKGSAVRDLGCSVAECKAYLESKFQSGMTWENYGKDGWHIDHIKPLSAFDLSDREQLIQACHYSNLQPLWAVDNRRKSDKYESAA